MCVCVLFFLNNYAKIARELSFSPHISIPNRSNCIDSTYLLSSPALHTCPPVAAKPHLHRFVRLPLIAPSPPAPRAPPPARLCDSRTTRMICLSFMSLVKPTPESQPLECNDGTDVSRLFKFLSNTKSMNRNSLQSLPGFSVIKSHILVLVLQRIVSDASIFVFHQIEIRI